jgi:hypothetical protein
MIIAKSTMGICDTCWERRSFAMLPQDLDVKTVGIRGLPRVMFFVREPQRKFSVTNGFQNVA